MPVYDPGKIEEYMEISGIPEYMRDGIKYYIEEGYQNGSFLTAYFENNFLKMCQYADDFNIFSLRNYGHFLHNYAPLGCYGSPEKVKNWIEHKGLKGLHNA